jgi:hypothetical protein
VSVDHSTVVAADAPFLPGRSRESLPTVEAALPACEALTVATALAPLPIWLRIRPVSTSRTPGEPQGGQ